MKDRNRKKKMLKRKNRVMFKHAISQNKSRKRKNQQDTTGVKIQKGERKIKNQDPVHQGKRAKL